MAVSPNLDKGFRDLMTETVTYAARSGQNEYNEPTYGTPVSYTARIVGKSMELRDAKGEETTVTYELWLDTVDIISPLGQLTLSGAKRMKTETVIFKFLVDGVTIVKGEVNG
jgi:uncharacterized lipoprotein NlpE involved in copper resistance